MDRKYKRAITYGTFDLFHFGHLEVLRRTAELADHLVVGVATDEFNSVKGKRAMIDYDHRAAIVRALRMVDEVIPERDWDQKRDDISTHDIDLLVMGDDWEGEFDSLSDVCDVVYLPRTAEISSTELRDAVRYFGSGEIARLQEAIRSISDVVRAFDPS